MRLFELTIILVVLLSGCAAPASSPRVITAPLAQGGTAAVPSACAQNGCSFEWWNATIVADAPWNVTLPVPMVWTDPTPMRVGDHAIWTGSPLVTGATAHVATEAHATQVALSGAGNATASWRMVRAPDAGETPDTFLRARWGPTAADVRPDALLVNASGAPNVTLTYEARSDLCERRAAFASEDGPTDGRLRLVGNDTARCP